MGRWGMKFTMSCLVTLQMLQTKFDKVCPSSSWEEDVNAQTDNNGHQPIAIDHLSDSGDLKILKHKNTTTLFKTIHLTF